VYLGAEPVFNFQNKFASESCAAVREALSNTYPDREVPNKDNSRQTGNIISGLRMHLSVTNVY
jgi:hypothetical protein